MQGRRRRPGFQPWAGKDPLQEGTATPSQCPCLGAGARGPGGLRSVGSHMRTRLGMGRTQAMGSREQARGEGTGRGGGCPVSSHWPPKLCSGRSFPFSLLMASGQALRSQASEAVCGEPAGAGSR